MSQQLELLAENPSQWVPVSFVTPEIQKKEIKPFVVLALKELEGNPDSRISSLMNADKYAAVRAVVRHVAWSRSATKEPWDSEDMKSFLEGLRFSTDCISELTALLCTDRIFDRVPSHLRVKRGLVSLRWKIDLSLSQSRMKTKTASELANKEMTLSETHIILILQLTDGQTYTYRMSLPKFHELRYVVASALKNLIVLERRKCMRAD